MTMNMNGAAKIVGSAMAVGGAAMLGAAMAKSSSSLKKKARKTAGKALDALDGVLNSVQKYVK